jgi:hypothetical protein
VSGLGAAFSVLMVGHSLFAFDGPAMLQSALRAGTGAAEVQAQIINGAPLQYNWQNSGSAEGVDARSVLPEGGIGHLILTEALPLDNHLTWSETGVFAEAFAALAMNASPEARVYVQETWHSLKSGTGAEIPYDEGADIPWRRRLEQDLPKWQGLVADLRRARPGAAERVSLIPAGQAMALLQDRIALGEVPGLASIQALFADDIHLNDRGHYFVAMVQYACLTGQSPLGLPTDFSDQWGNPFETPDPALARQLQEIAWEAVTAYRSGTPRAAAAPPPAAVPRAADPARAPPVQETALELPQPDGVVAGQGATGMNLAAVKDWSTQQPFLDLMKTARPWIGHLPGKWGGMDREALRAEGFLDAEGWPKAMPRRLSSIGTLVLTDLPEAATSLSGRYLLRYSGKGVIEVTGRARNVRYGKGEVRFDYSPGPGAVDIRIQRINRTDPPRITSIVREDRVAAYDAGAIFNPDWLARLRGFDSLRFMDWMETNNATLSRWEDRPRLESATWFDGVPLEVMLALANELEADPWFTLPHLADDAFVRAFAEMVRERLDPARRTYLEFSNEVWNWQFTQAAWADAQARERWGVEGAWVQYYGLRAAQVMELAAEAFGPSAADRLVRVVATQTDWLGLEADILQAPLVTAEGLPPPARSFDAYAVTGYFGGQLGSAERAEEVAGWLEESRAAAEEEATARGLLGAAHRDHVTRHAYDQATDRALEALRTGPGGDSLAHLLGRLWPHHAAVAQENGLALLAYEGGTHVVGLGSEVENEDLTAFMHHFNYSPEVAELYEIALEGWRTLGGGLFQHFQDVAQPSKWGSFGGLRHLDDANPRWDLMVAAQ